MKKILITIITLLISSLAFAEELKDNFKVSFFPNESEEGYPISINGLWKIADSIEMPVTVFEFDWNFKTNNDKVLVHFKPYGMSHMIKVHVPSSVVKQSAPLEVTLYGELEGTKGYARFKSVANEIGKLSTHFNAPDWSEILFIGNEPLSNEEGFRLFYNMIGINLAPYRHNVTFDLSAIKHWYAKSQREKSLNLLCNGTINIYDKASSSAPYLRARKQKILDLCQQDKIRRIPRLLKELDYIKKLSKELKGNNLGRNNNLPKYIEDYLTLMIKTHKELNDSDLSSKEIYQQYLAEYEENRAFRETLIKKRDSGLRKYMDRKYEAEKIFNNFLQLLSTADIRKPLSAEMKFPERNFTLREKTMVDIQVTGKVTNQDYTEFTGEFDICEDILPYFENGLHLAKARVKAIRFEDNRPGGVSSDDGITFHFTDESVRLLKREYKKVVKTCNKL